MGLKKLDLQQEYRSFQNDIIREFYIPVLSKTKEYKRAVGFFSSTALIQISKGISELVKNGGKMKLLTSPILSEEDIEAMKIGYDTRSQIITKRLMENLLSHEGKNEDKERLNLLANLIADGILDIKVILLTGNGYGIYHEKMGIIQDEFNNKIVFSGSMNESMTALTLNYESIDVFCSWKGDDERINSKEEAFDNMWNNNYEDLTTIEIPHVKNEFIKRYKTGAPNYNIDIESVKGYKGDKKLKDKWINKPKYVKSLHDYQIEAIENWEIQEFQGIFDMATGTGKTLTALGGLSKLAEKLNNKLGIIVICPYQHLVEQWVEDIEACGVNPLICYSSYNWKNEFKREIRNYSMGISDRFFIVTTNMTFSTEFFQSQIDKLRGDICLVVDEAHNFGTQRQAQLMKEIYKYRLALSATLERHHDETGTQKLYDFFGKKCIEYDLNRAIDEEKLSKYFYYPVPITLTEEELEEYDELSIKIGRALGGRKIDDTIPASVEMLLIKRSRIIAGAKNKIDALCKIIREEYINDNQMLVYCGSANVSYFNYEEGNPTYDEKRQIDVVIDKLGNELGMKVSKFTSEENYIERDRIKKRFAEGEMIQALIAIRCLDEGVNIPSIRTAFLLASSTNPKEYIQRRGRVLRLYKNKDYATIYDFITLPRDLDSYFNLENVSKGEISLIKKELTRVREFSRLSENESDSDRLVEKIKEAYKFYYNEYEGDEING